MPNSKHVLDHSCEEHPVGKPTDQEKAQSIDSLTKTTNISSHVEKGVSNAFILYHSIRQTKVALVIGIGINSTDSDGLDGVY